MQLIKKIIQYKTITPDTSKCQNVIAHYFKKIGFQKFTFTKKGIKNTVLIRYNTAPKTTIQLAFLGHTDTVNASKKEWQYPPYKMTLANKKIIGRGICDMKGAIFAFYIAVKLLIKQSLKHNIAVILTGDEEGVAKYGTRFIVKKLGKKLNIHTCIIGEPTSEKKIGDVIKTGRRGSCNLKIKIQSKHQHIAYVQQKFSHCTILQPIIACIAKHKANIWNITTNTQVANITPKFISIYINIRYRTTKILTKLLKALQTITTHTKTFKIKQKILSIAPPFKTSKHAKLAHILQTYANSKVQNTHGGTSDGRFIIAISKYIVEIGLINKTIHSKNENISIKALFKLIIIYVNSIYMYFQ
ncbi:M20/M25/M40 family metallo-hydrolase [Candidatus Vidania fulgoroideorum]